VPTVMSHTRPPNTLVHYPSPLRKVSTTHSHFPWHHQAKHIKKTPTEKAQLQAKHTEFCQQYAAALNAARKVVMEQAVILCEKIGRHSIKYYFEEIMQRSHLQSKSRKVTRWNAFIRCEVARHNSGTRNYGPLYV
jgi:hypothetical protein